MKVEDSVLAGFGWQREDMKLVQQMASNGAEPIGSLGYDGPLAALSAERQNLADYFKETVAVVTNPAIDREREIEHFSCRAVFGARPSIERPGAEPRTIETAFPIILGGHHDMAPLSDEVYRRVAKEHKTYLLEDLWEAFRGRGAVLDISCLESETTQGALERLKYEAAKKVLDGAELLVLSDRTAYEGERPFLDPHLALSAIDGALREYRVAQDEENLRRRTSIVLRSGAIRNVHDVCMALGLGADGVCPYVMIEVICVDDYETDISNICSALRKGIEKVISTLGIHEVRGYARLFSSIGLQAGADRDLRDPRLLRLRAGRHRLRASSTPRPAARQRILAGRRRTSRPRRSASTRRSTRPRSPRRTAHSTFEEYSAQGARARARAADLDAAHHRPAAPTASRSTFTGRRRRRPPLLSDRDLVDVVRLAGRDGVPRLPGGREADQHHLRQRRGRRDPRHVRQVPEVARAAGRLGPLRRHVGDAQLLLPGRDQDRPGRQARRGRSPAREEGLREGRRRA